MSAETSAAHSFDGALLGRMFRELVRLRALDECMVGLQRQGRISFYGACTGQEGCVVGTGLALGANDWVFPALRESGIMLVRGFPLAAYLAQLFGNANDVLKGRQMPSHMSGRSVRQVSWSSCIGTQLPHAVGAAWAAKLRGDQVVTVGFVGDGGTSTPDFHAAMNFAAVFRVPTVLICQNNQYAISLPSSRQTAAPTFAAKASAYGMPAVRADGNDVLAVYEVISSAIQTARTGGGPTFVELVTYRMGGHSTSDDPTRYRTSAEVDAWRAKDPIRRLADVLRGAGQLSEEQEQGTLDAVRAEIVRAIDEVEPVGRPDLATLFQDVYAEPPWHLMQQWRSAAHLPSDDTSLALAAHPIPPDGGQERSDNQLHETSQVPSCGTGRAKGG